MERDVAPGQLWMMSNGRTYLVLSFDEQRSAATKSRCWLVFSEESHEVCSWSEFTMGPGEGDVLVASSPFVPSR
jgi:hypothetical protein